ncbi:MAG: response regulator [Desulfobacterales bacterium]|nr:response regulator [Desulfobacterales bacterium]
MIDLENMAILIVDDMKSMRSIIKKTLRNLNIGRFIYFAENGLEGMRCLNDKKVDLAIVDWKMPVMNGAQMLDAIRNDKQLRDMPVLMVTAESERDIVYEVAEIEVDGYLLKPLTPAMLEEKILQAMHRANHPDEATLFVRKARALEEAGRLDMAIRCQQRAVELKPNASRLKRNLGILYGKSGKMTTMEKCYLEAAAINLQDAVTRHLLSKFYWQKKEWNLSVKYECEVLSLTNRFNDYAVKEGKQLLALKQNDLAVVLFAKLIGKLEKNLPVKEEILDLCMEHEEYAFAEKLLVRLLREFPSNHGLFYKAGLIYEAIGDNDQALEYFLASDKNMIHPIKSKLKVARLYYLKNKVIQADDFLTAVLRIEPDNEEALELRRSF